MVLRAAQAGLTSFNAVLFLGDEAQQPDVIEGSIEALPPHLSNLAIPDGAEVLTHGRTKIFYRVRAYNHEVTKDSETRYEWSKVTLDNGIQLYEFVEEGGIVSEYNLIRLEPLPDACALGGLPLTPATATLRRAPRSNRQSGAAAAL